MPNNPNYLRDEQLQAQLDAMYASTSWRITAPLRKISTAGRISYQLVKSPRSTGKQLILSLVRRSVPHIRRSRLLMNGIAFVRQKNPETWQRLTMRLRSAIPPVTTGALSPAAPSLSVGELEKKVAEDPYARQFRHALGKELMRRKIQRSEP